MGSLGTAFFLSYMITALILGCWRIGCRARVLVGASVLLWSVASGASGLAGTFTLLLITRLTSVKRAMGRRQRRLFRICFGRAARACLSWFYLAIPVGNWPGLRLGRMDRRALGLARSVLCGDAAGILLGVLSFFLRDPGASARAQERALAYRPGLQDYLKLLRVKSYVLDSLGMAAMTFAIGGISFWMPRYLTEVRGQTAGSKVMFGGILCASGFLATMAGGYAGDWLKKYWRGSYFLVSGAAMLCACPFILLMLWTPFPFAWVWIFLAVFYLDLLARERATRFWRM